MQISPLGSPRQLALCQESCACALTQPVAYKEDLQVHADPERNILAPPLDRTRPTSPPASRIEVSRGISSRLPSPAAPCRRRPPGDELGRAGCKGAARIRETAWRATDHQPRPDSVCVCTLFPGQLSIAGCCTNSSVGYTKQMGPQRGSSGNSSHRAPGMSDTVKGAIIGALGAVAAAVLTAVIGHSAGVVYIGALPSPSQVPTSLPNSTDSGSTPTDGATTPQPSSFSSVAAPLYTAPFTVHGPNADTCNTWVYVAFSATGPIVDSVAGDADLDFDCSDSGLPEVRPALGGTLAIEPSKPDATTCVSATQRDPLPALALRDMKSNMWLCVDDSSLVTAMQLQTPPSQAAATGVVSFIASSWPT